MGLEGFGLLVGHMMGDYILQNDWMARNKTLFGYKPRINNLGEFNDVTYVTLPRIKDPSREEHRPGSAIYEQAKEEEFAECRRKTVVGTTACITHCACYTLAVWACSYWWMPWWGPMACLLIHYPIDRYRLAGWWMRNVSGQSEFAAGPLAPWSVIVVDNTFHLLTLFVIGLIQFT